MLIQYKHDKEDRTFYKTVGLILRVSEFIAMYDSGCHICCNWSRLKPVLRYQHTRSTMPQINMIIIIERFH